MSFRAREAVFYEAALQVRIALDVLGKGETLSFSKLYKESRFGYDKRLLTCDN